MYMEMQKNKLELLKKDILNSLTTMQRDIGGVFKDKETGIAYDINGRYFQEPDNDCSFRCRESQVKIEFPYTPKDKIPVYKLKYKIDDVPIAEALEKGLYEIL